MDDTSSPRLVITTARRPTDEMLARADRWANWLAAPIIDRRGRSVTRLCREEKAEGVLVLQADRTIYFQPSAGIEYFFHPNLASVRIHNLLRGTGDHMVDAMRLQPGDEVLDCTLGRASDALICAHVVFGQAPEKADETDDTATQQGRVVGIEKVPLLAYLTIDGLQNTSFVSKRFTALMRRIEAYCAGYEEFLAQCSKDSFDVVYFDPIFHAPVEESQSMEDLRALAHKHPLSEEAVENALRVARRCVVIKQRRETPLWDRLGVTETHGGKQSRVEYGVLPAR